MATTMQPIGGHVRKITNEHTNLGTSSNSPRGARSKIAQLLVYPDSDLHGNEVLAISTVNVAGKAPVLHLREPGQMEIVKGILMNMLRRPIGMAANEEFQQILAQVQAAIKSELDDASAMVAAVRANHLTPPKETKS